MTAEPLSAALQGRVAAMVAEAVAAERVRVADELRALLMDRDALHAWLAAHGLGDPGLGAALAVLNRDLRGTCAMCRGPAEFVGEVTGVQRPQDPASDVPDVQSHQPTPQSRSTEPTGRS